jgi:hypothetical protein
MNKSLLNTMQLNTSKVRFLISITMVPILNESSHGEVLGQAINFKCLIWIVSLGMVEQRQL